LREIISKVLQSGGLPSADWLYTDEPAKADRRRFNEWETMRIAGWNGGFVDSRKRMLIVGHGLWVVFALALF